MFSPVVQHLGAGVETKRVVIRVIVIILCRNVVVSFSCVWNFVSYVFAGVFSVIYSHFFHKFWQFK